MTSISDRAFVWTWLPGHSEPVVAGVLERRGGRFHFAYGTSYLQRSDAISLYAPELPLREGWIEPLDGLSMPSCLRDGAPDAWGRRFINARLTGGRASRGSPVDELDELTYLLGSGSNRFGANDFQSSPTKYTARADVATLDELHDAADRVVAGERLHPALADALVHGTSIGGARPKAVIVGQDGAEHIAKFSLSNDAFPVVNAEAVGLALARRVGLAVPASKVVSSLGKDVLLVERFDRDTERGRTHVVSGLTILGLDEMMGRYATYPDLVDQLRVLGADPAVGKTVFERIVFNVAIGNTDDHARNHAAFWDGTVLDLAPAYDLCPQARTGETAQQAMAIDRENTRSSTFAACVNAAHVYGLSQPEATAVVDHTIATIHDAWHDIADEARLTQVDRDFLWGRQILNPYTAYDYTPTVRRSRPGRPGPGA